MLENSRTFLVIRIRRIGARQSVIEHVRDCKFELRAGGGFLPPIEDEQLFESCQELPRYLSNFGAFFRGQVRCRASEDVEDDQLLLRHIFADVALLLVGQNAAQCDQFVE